MERLEQRHLVRKTLVKHRPVQQQRLERCRRVTVAGGLAGATDLAVGPRGRVFVAEMFGNRISEITKSGLRTVSELPMPSAIDWRSGRLIVTYDAFGSGKVGVLTP